MDLLTVIMHELGHRIGLEDSYLPAADDDLMYGFLDPGERQLPAPDDVAAADPSGQLVQGWKDKLALELDDEDRDANMDELLSGFMENAAQIRAAILAGPLGEVATQMDGCCSADLFIPSALRPELLTAFEGSPL